MGSSASHTTMTNTDQKQQPTTTTNSPLRPSTFKLASVKKKLYHPQLPTIRNMDRDDVCMRLASEHSRTTTVCTHKDFSEVDRLNVGIDKGERTFWTSQYVPSSQEGVSTVVHKVFNELDSFDDKEEAVVRHQYTRCDGQTLEKKELLLVNPTGRYVDESGKIEFEGYPVRRDLPSKTHNWIVDLN